MKRVFSFLILIIIIIGMGYYVINLATPSDSEITAIEKKVEPVTKNIVDEDVLTKLQGLVSHGNLPVTVDPGEIGKSSPFE